MDQHVARRRRVSRETRLLLVTALLSVIALWVLARIRFPDRPASPVQPLLTQLAPRPALDSLASEIAQLRPRLEPLLVGPALRVRDDAALALIDGSHEHDEVIGFDPASRLAVTRAPFLPAPPPVAWNPRDMRDPRYLIVADASTGTIALRPVFVGLLSTSDTPLWPQPVWLVPAGIELTPGSFVFTTDALLAGLVIDVGQQLAILPGTVVLTEADRLLNEPKGTPGVLGVDVQELTPSLARATGAAIGVVVSHVDPDGPSARVLAIGDVIEMAGNTPLETPLHWRAQASRVKADQTLTVHVRRHGESREITLVAAPPHVRQTPGPRLGLQLRNVPGTGSAITRVEPESIADRAGLRVGDVMTLVGRTKAPSPAVVTRIFEGAAVGEAILVAFVRDRASAVTALEK